MPVADLTVEQFEQLPDFVKGDYEQSGEVYRPKAEGKAAALKASLDALDGKFKSTDAQLKEILSKHEEDRTKAEQAALDRLKKEGKVDEILADYERRATETKAQYEARIEKLAGQIKTEKRASLVSDIAGQLKIFDESKKLFSKLIQDRIEIDPETGKETYLDETGGATSLDKSGFIAELAKDTAYDRLRSAEANKGGSANGNNSNGGGASKKFNEYTGAELKAIKDSDPGKYKALRDDYYGTEG
jgi:hypothetical protein